MRNEFIDNYIDEDGKVASQYTFALKAKIVQKNVYQTLKFL